MELKVKKVQDDCDPLKMGRVFSDGIWYSPICCDDDGQFFIPRKESVVVVLDSKYYLGTINEAANHKRHYQ